MKDTPPDIILSGVNRGRNAAEDVTYSGTVAGAMEGSVLGVRSFALSQSFSAKTRQKPMWETGVRFGPEVVRKVLAANFPTDTIININFPDCAPEEVAGIAITRQGKRNQDLLNIDARHDGRGNPYYWIAYQRGAAWDPPEEGTDLAALGINFVSVTPLRLDLTHDAMMARMIAAIGA
jgi:5'-nucleotidase